MTENTTDWANCIPTIPEYSSADEKMAELNEEMAKFVGAGFTPEPIKSIEIKPYDFTEDEFN